MSKAKDFQRATAERIIEVFKSGQKRVLLSDEVGLGKTIIAKTVMENAKNLQGVDEDGVYRVVYVCSNQNIIQQNTRNLGVPKEDIMQLRDSRLSMQHLILKEREIRMKEKDTRALPLQLIPLTPSTSFNITCGAGNDAERALIFTILRHMDEFAGKTETLSDFLRTTYKGKSAWDNLVTSVNKRVCKCGDGYINNILTLLRANTTFQKHLGKLIYCVSSSGNNKNHLALIGKLRIAFAEISLNMLNPDLVIMDEFQRFSELLNPSELSEESMIASKFFSNDSTYVLLLSATPYKPFTTLEELNENNCDEQYRDFLKLTDFLFKGSTSNEHESFRTVWEDYSNKLSHLSGDTFDALVISKQKAEDKMYSAVCRTERYRKGLIRETSMGGGPICISEDDILAYCQMQKLLQSITPCFNIPIEYVKSSPYLLSFMKNYQEGKAIEAAFMGKNVPLVKNSRTQRLLLKGEHIYNYKEIKPANAKLKALEDMLFSNNAEFLLWVPASHPYYTIPPDNVFAKNKDFSKVLVFSAWEMVPRMLAVMLSYESERRNITKAYKGTTYSSKKHTKDLFSSIEELLLQHPSAYLAGKYVPEDHFGQDISHIVDTITSHIQQDIDALGLPVQKEESEKFLLTLIKTLDGQDTDITHITQGAARTLALMAIASPAVCMLRILQKAKKPDGATADYVEAKATEVADCITSMFNKREASAAVKRSTPKASYYEQVLHYCMMGNLQSVLDEFCHMADEGGHAEHILERLTSSFVHSSTLKVHTTDSYCKIGAKQASVRRNFAFDYGKVEQDATEKHNFTLQQAFNSPFRPFLLATTSVGQEGLDFHWYSRKIVHWNLPSNPVDLEQRDGRINRYKCHAIRRNVAKFFGEKFTWEKMFDEASRVWREQSHSDYSDMVPYWCLPEDIVGSNDIEHIERIVPLYPMSIDEVRYKHLVDVLSLYRLTMGQPRQEELLQLLEGKVTPEQMEQLLFDLSPYNKGKSLSG